MPERDLATVTHWLHRVTKAQKVMFAQFDLLETMTAMDFLDFRDYLVPASGFQSCQFRQIEILWGLPIDGRKYGSCSYLMGVFSEEHKKTIDSMPDHDQSLLRCVERWLERMPFTDIQIEGTDYNFWGAYALAIEAMLAKEEDIIKSVFASEIKNTKFKKNTQFSSQEGSLEEDIQENPAPGRCPINHGKTTTNEPANSSQPTIHPTASTESENITRLESELKGLDATRTNFSSLFNQEMHNEMIQRGVRKFSHKAFLNCLFIFLYRDEPVLQGPFAFFFKTKFSRCATRIF